MISRTVVLAVAAVAVTGCTPSADDPTAAASRVSQAAARATTSAAPSTTPVRKVVVLRAEQVAGVPVGTPQDEARRRLTAALGRPRESVLPGCYGEQGQALRWGTVTAYLSNRGQGPVVLSGWAVLAGPSSYRFDLPYGTSLGSDLSEVEERVPHPQRELLDEGPRSGATVVRTADVPELLWWGDAEVLTELSFRDEECD